jgi:nitroimidazol reductase NimA-like FMN-containing flavoprotein (pyridoxamine 5'-phosphate oxidase superfamily)
MTLSEPGAADVERAIADLLRAEQVGALATLSATGAPSVALMHFASDGLAVYLHTFTDTRKYAAIRRDNRVSYTLAYQPSDGFDERRQLRAVQVDGTATILTDPAEIDRAVLRSREQFDWLKDSRMYDNVQRAVAAQRQVFFRVDPVEALWTDNRVRLLWRRLVTFTPDGRHVAELVPYDVAVG